MLGRNDRFQSLLFPSLLVAVPVGWVDATCDLFRLVDGGLLDAVTAVHDAALAAGAAASEVSLEGSDENYPPGQARGTLDLMFAGW